jgi:hypothetical protein
MSQRPACLLDHSSLCTLRSALCRFFWAAGLIGLPLSHWFLLAPMEPFYSGIYSCLWWSYIFAADFAVWRLRGSSMLRDRPCEFLLLALWSTPVWMIFEAINLRLRNWYYVQAPYELDASGVLMLFSFATVLPGLFETAELALGVIERWTPKGRIAGRPFRVTRAHVAAQIAIGAAMLALPLLWPERFFCLTWGFAFLLLDPICWTKKGRSLLSQLASGDNTRLVALLVAGFICGGLWEAWNLPARTKWIYTVPFFDQLKIGEMPIHGFLGFPPFVLECYAIVNFITLFRDGRNWELSGAENLARRGMRRLPVLGAWIATALFMIATGYGIIMYTVSSVSIPLDVWFAGQLGPHEAEALRREGARFSHELIRLKARPDGINEALYEQMRSVCAMAELKGMGLLYANLLIHGFCIRTPMDLVKQNPELLAQRIRRALNYSTPIREEQVRVWIREARKKAWSEKR